MPKFEIKDWRNDRVIYTGEAETLCELVERGVREGVSLNYASLNYARLNYASLDNASLNYARLNYASLNYASLNYARLNYVSLDNASLDNASLNYASLPAPSVFIGLVNWGEVSDELCADLMLWDAANHPDPTAFDRWATTKDGPCPYSGDVRVNRACWFQEKRALWGKGQVCRPWDLMQRLLAEKCPPWTDEQIKEFEAKHAEIAKAREGGK